MRKANTYMYTEKYERELEDEYINNEENDSSGIYLGMIDMNSYREQRISEGKDFIIDIHFKYDKIDIDEFDKTELLLSDTIYSAKRFGPQKYENADVQQYRYQCECGGMIGHDNIGEFCPICQTQVKKKEYALDIMGWIPLPMPVLTPRGAFHVRKALSGNSKTKGSKIERLISGVEPFEKDDLFLLYERFDKLEQFVKNKKHWRFLKANKNKLFTTHFPVLTRRLRRFMITRNGDIAEIQADRLSQKYLEIIGHCLQAESEHMTTLNKNKVAAKIIRTSFEVYSIMGEELAASKEKTIRGEIYSTRNAYSGRLLIEPDIVLQNGHGDECRTSYDAFRTLHKVQVMRDLMNKKGYSRLHAERVTDVDFIITDDDKKALDELIDTGDYWMQINRPPTIDFSGIVTVKIAKLCNENVLYINSILCGEIRGDFDGDTLSVYNVDTNVKWRMKYVSNPRRHSIWWDRSINNAYSALNDHVVTTHMILDEGGVEFINEDKIS